MKKNIKNSPKNRARLAILYLMIYAVILSYFYYAKYIDFTVIRTIYMPILGVSMLAILLDYLVFGQVFLAASVLGLAAEFAIHAEQGAKLTMRGAFTNSAILMLGFIVGFILQMYIKTKKGK